ncbi:MAG: hypothetical protein ACLFVQ_13800 [Chitinispirillaceae bacterium]
MVDYTKYWSVPLVLAFFILAALLFFVREVKIKSETEIIQPEKGKIIKTAG